MENKRGQMKLSFGMIFSIFLIIIFIAVAIFAITKFLNLQQELKYRSFVEDFQNDIDKMWKGTQGSQQLTYDLPSKVISVCFIKKGDFEDNFQIVYERGFSRKESINHINLEKILGSQDKFCIESVDSKIILKIEKSYGENLIRVSNVE